MKKELKRKFNYLIKGVKIEAKETKEAFQLILKGKKDKKVKEQIKDLGRIVLAVSIFVLPAGSAIIALISKFNKNILLPSAFRD